jgi:hypothetical protein
MQKQTGIRAMTLTLLLGASGIAQAGQGLYTVNCAPNNIAYWVFFSTSWGHDVKFTSGLAVDKEGKPLSCEEARKLADEAKRSRQ